MITIEDVKEDFLKNNYKLLTTTYSNQFQKLEYICPQGHQKTTTWKYWKKGSRCDICSHKSITIDTVRKSFEQCGYTLLSEVYESSKKKLDYKCDKGHINSIPWSYWNDGNRCPDCAGSKRLTIDFIKSKINEEGYALLSSEYKNNHTPFSIKCDKGHIYETHWNIWSNGHRCPICYSQRINIDFIRGSFEKEGYELFSTTYKDAHTKLDFKCCNGHIYNMTWASWQQGGRCYFCKYDNNRVPIAEVRDRFEKRGYIFIESSYGKEKLEYICPKGHRGSTTLGNWGSENGCTECSGKAKLVIEYVKKEIESEGYKLITDDYKNNRAKLHLICPNGHDYFASWFDWNSNKVRCYKCKDKGTSLQEQEVISYIKELGINYELHDRYLIHPYELDIVIPDKKIAIEYCGLYWHSELSGKPRQYHLNKLELCNKIGYKLITIFEDEWILNNEITKNRLKHILGLNTTNKIYARKCIIKEISVEESSNFINTNHIQGNTGSSIKLGAFYNNELVSVMTFSKPSIAKGMKNISDNTWELSRFCTKLDYSVIGIASKLLKHFERNYEWKQVFSFADRRWSNGNLYNNIGFTFNSLTVPNYWYVKSNKRVHRFSMRKTSDEPKDRTEWDLRQEQGWDRIWDCGSLKYIKEKEI